MTTPVDDTQYMVSSTQPPGDNDLHLLAFTYGPS